MKTINNRICIIGLEREIVNEIKRSYFGAMIYHTVVPKIITTNGDLYVEKSNGPGMLPVDRVIFHGIYENDLNFITGLALWGGRCFPNAFAMMNCRLKLPCLARALKVSNYGTTRGFISQKTAVTAKSLTVAKWGNWHCGENKDTFSDNWVSSEDSVLEPFFEGDAVRVVSIGNSHMQIKLEGKTWLKSIHDEAAHIMPLKPKLLHDTLKIKNAFGMNMIANDYILSSNGEAHLLEVNHIPNVSRFDELKSIYIQEVTTWLCN